MSSSNGIAHKAQDPAGTGRHGVSVTARVLSRNARVPSGGAAQQQTVRSRTLSETDARWGDSSSTHPESWVATCHSIGILYYFYEYNQAPECIKIPG